MDSYGGMYQMVHLSLPHTLSSVVVIVSFRANGVESHTFYSHVSIFGIMIVVLFEYLHEQSRIPQD
jgi:hypothetical protein